MHKYAGITLLLSFAMLWGCSSTVLVPVPPRMDLKGYGTLGIVEFGSNADPAINVHATRQFQEQIQAAQLKQSAELEKKYAALDRDGQLLLAARNGDVKRVEQLLGSGASVHAREKKRPNIGRTALHEAARLYNIEVAKVILSAKGIRVDELNAKGETALHTVARSDGPEMVPMLLKRGADKSLRTPEGKTALELAEAKGGGWKTTADLLR